MAAGLTVSRPYAEDVRRPPAEHFLDKIGKGARIGARQPTLRKHRPEINGRQRPVRQKTRPPRWRIRERTSSQRRSPAPSSPALPHAGGGVAQVMSWGGTLDRKRRPDRSLSGLAGRDISAVRHLPIPQSPCSQSPRFPGLLRKRRADEDIDVSGLMLTHEEMSSVLPPATHQDEALARQDRRTSL